MNPALTGALMGAGKGIAQGDDLKGIAKKAAIGGVTGFAGGQGLEALGSSGLTPAAENIIVKTVKIRLLNSLRTLSEELLFTTFIDLKILNNFALAKFNA